MGAGIPLGARAILCDGKDVGKELKRVFGKPGSKEFIAAQAQQAAFASIANGNGDYTTLYKAYTDAGVAPCDSWNLYLKTLTLTVVQKIAAARYLGLSTNTAMITSTHDPKKNGDHDVHVSSGLDDGTIMIDSPFTPG